MCCPCLYSPKGSTISSKGGHLKQRCTEPASDPQNRSASTVSVPVLLVTCPGQQGAGYDGSTTRDLSGRGRKLNVRESQSTQRLLTSCIEVQLHLSLNADSTFSCISFLFPSPAPSSLVITYSISVHGLSRVPISSSILIPFSVSAYGPAPISPGIPAMVHPTPM